MQQYVRDNPRQMRSARFVTAGCSVVASLVLAAMPTRSAGAEPDAAKPAAPAKPESVALALDSSTTVVLDKEINGMPAQTKLIATPSFPEYALAPVVDGIKKRKELGWQECSWASAEDETAHGVEIQFSTPQRGGRFQVTWAYDIFNEDNGKWWISRDYVIQIKGKADDSWKTVITVKNNQSIVGCYPLPDESFGYLRDLSTSAGRPCGPPRHHVDRPVSSWLNRPAARPPCAAPALCLVRL